MEPHLTTSNRRFFEGYLNRTMPALIEEGYEPASLVDVVEEEECPGMFFYTADTATTHARGDVVLTLNAAELRNITRDTRLYEGAFVLTDSQFEDVRTRENSLFLPHEKADNAQNRGVVKVEGRWTPVNTVVGECLDFLFRGKDYQDYVKRVSERFPRTDELLKVNFDLRPHYGVNRMRSIPVLEKTICASPDGIWSREIYARGVLVGKKYDSSGD